MDIVSKLNFELLANIFNSKDVNVCFDNKLYSTIEAATTKKSVSSKFICLKEWIRAGLLHSARIKQVIQKS